MKKLISMRRLNLLREAGFTEDQIDKILEIMDMRKRKTAKDISIEVGSEFVYTPNGTHVYVSRIYKKGRWEYAELRGVDGDFLFDNGELTHYLADNEYDFWDKVA